MARHPVERRSEILKSHRGPQTAEELRRCRESATNPAASAGSVDLRRVKREETLNKRRNMLMVTLGEQLGQFSPQLSLTENTQQLQPRQVEDLEEGEGEDDYVISSGYVRDETLKNLPIIVQVLQDSNTEPPKLLANVTLLRKILSKQRKPPIGKVVSTGIVPRLVQLLAKEGLTSFSPSSSSLSTDIDQQLIERIQLEAAWCITNIASGTAEQTLTVVEARAAPVLISVISTHPVTTATDCELVDQCIWALGNIAGDSAQCRDYLLHIGFMGPLLEILKREIANPKPNLGLLRNAVWALSNCFRGKPSPVYELVASALPILAILIQANDEAILVDSAWAFTFFSDGSARAVTSIIESGALPALVNLLRHPSTEVQTPALRAIGNIVTGDEMQTQAVLDVGALESLGTLLNSPRSSIRKETCWTLSNITAGTPDQVKEVLRKGLMKPLVELLSSQSDLKVRKEACWAVCNATSLAEQEPDIIHFMITECSIVKPICEMLEVSDARITQVALDGLENILKAGAVIAAATNADSMMDTHNHGSSSTLNPFAPLIEEAGGVERMFRLQSSTNPTIQFKCQTLLTLYYEGEEEDTNVGDEDNALFYNNHEHAYDSSSFQVPHGGFSF